MVSYLGASPRQAFEFSFANLERLLRSSSQVPKRSGDVNLQTSFDAPTPASAKLLAIGAGIPSGRGIGIAGDMGAAGVTMTEGAASPAF